MGSLSMHSTGDNSPIRLVRVSDCRRFFNLDAFGLSPIERRLLSAQ